MSETSSLKRGDRVAITTSSECVFLPAGITRVGFVVDTDPPIVDAGLKYGDTTVLLGPQSYTTIEQYSVISND